MTVEEVREYVELSFKQIMRREYQRGISILHKFIVEEGFEEHEEHYLYTFYPSTQNIRDVSKDVLDNIIRNGCYQTMSGLRGLQPKPGRYYYLKEATTICLVSVELSDTDENQTLYIHLVGFREKQ